MCAAPVTLLLMLLSPLVFSFPSEHSHLQMRDEDLEQLLPYERADSKMLRALLHHLAEVFTDRLSRELDVFDRLNSNRDPTVNSPNTGDNANTKRGPGGINEDKSHCLVSKCS